MILIPALRGGSYKGIMNELDKANFIRNLKKRFGERKNNPITRQQLVMYMNDCGPEERELCVQYMDWYCDKMCHQRGVTK